MAKVIASVPESIDRKDYIEWFTRCGFIPSDIISLKFTAKGVYAKVFERDENGKRIPVFEPEVDERVANMAFSDVFIPVLPFYEAGELNKLSADMRKASATI